MTLIAPQNSDLQKMVKSNLEIWSSVTNIPETIINTYISTSIPNIDYNTSNTSNIITKKLTSSEIKKFESYNLIRAYITKNDNINLQTLNMFIDKLALPLLKLKLINNFMGHIFPQKSAAQPTLTPTLEAKENVVVKIW